MMAVKNRIFYFDFLRALAIMMVILCHVSGLYPYVNTSFKLAIPSFLNIIGLIGVLIFFMISGALLLNKDYTISSFLKKRFLRILVPFIFWISITIILGLTFFDYKWEYIQRLILGDGLYTWFIWVMMGIYLFVPVINSFVKEFSLKGLEYFLIIWSITILLNTIGMFPFYRLELSNFSEFLGYFVLGYYLANKEFNIDSKVICTIGLLLFIICSLILMYLNYTGVKLPGSSYLNIFIVFESLGVFIFVKELFKRFHVDEIRGKRKYVVNFIVSVSITSYSIYFTHKLILSYFSTLSINSMKLLPVIFIVTVIGSWIISLGVSKIPVIGEISGVK